MHTYLSITVTEASVAAVPGYEGDSRVSWKLEKTSSYPEAFQKSIDSICLLQSFWHTDYTELSFEAFFNLSCRQHLEEIDASNSSKPFSLGFSISSAVGADDSFEESKSDHVDRLNLPVTQEDLVMFSKYLVDHSECLPVFLTDLRDWDAFRLLMRRHKIRSIDFQPDRLGSVISEQKTIITRLSDRISEIELNFEQEKKFLLESLCASHAKTQSLMNLLHQSLTTSDNAQFNSVLEKLNQSINTSSSPLSSAPGLQRKGSLKLSGSSPSRTKKKVRFKYQDNALLTNSPQFTAFESDGGESPCQTGKSGLLSASEHDHEPNSHESQDQFETLETQSADGVPFISLGLNDISLVRGA